MAQSLRLLSVPLFKRFRQPLSYYRAQNNPPSAISIPGEILLYINNSLASDNTVDDNTCYETVKTMQKMPVFQVKKICENNTSTTLMNYFLLLIHNVLLLPVQQCFC